METVVCLAKLEFVCPLRITLSTGLDPSCVLRTGSWGGGREVERCQQLMTKRRNTNFFFFSIGKYHYITLLSEKYFCQIQNSKSTGLFCSFITFKMSFFHLTVSIICNENLSILSIAVHLYKCLSSLATFKLFIFGFQELTKMWFYLFILLGFAKWLGPFINFRVFLTIISSAITPHFPFLLIFRLFNIFPQIFS